MAPSQDLSRPNDELPAMPKLHPFQVGEFADRRCVESLTELGSQALDIRVKRPIQLHWFSTREGFHVQALALGEGYTGKGATPEEAITELQQVIVNDVRLFRAEHERRKMPTETGRACAERLNRFVEIFSR